MSIVRLVPWEQFTKIVGVSQFTSFINSGPIRVIIFITDWSYPSRLALKRIKKLHFDKQLCGVVDVDLVDSIQLVDRYSVHSVPHCILFRNGKIQTELSGFRIETLGEIFASLVAEYRVPRPPPQQSCPQGHILELKQQLPLQIYPEGYFYCDSCRKIEKCQKDKPTAHCEQCDFDVCYECQHAD